MAWENIGGGRYKNSAALMVICFAKILNAISGDQEMVKNKERAILRILTKLKIKSENVVVKMWGKKTTEINRLL